MIIRLPAALLFLVLLSGCAGTEKTTEPGKSTDIIHPVLIHQPVLIYPEKAELNGIEGQVTIYLYVNDSGKVVETKITSSSGSDLLDSAAAIYVRKMVFKPAQRENKNTGVWISYKIHYTLYPSDESFSINTFLQTYPQNLNVIASASGTEREQSWQTLIDEIETYAGYSIEHPQFNYNFRLADILTQITIDKWKKYFAYWPLTFILYDDLMTRFSDRDELSGLKERMFASMQHDLTRAAKMDRSDQKHIVAQFAGELLAYLKKNFPDQISADFKQELENFALPD